MTSLKYWRLNLYVYLPHGNPIFFLQSWKLYYYSLFSVKEIASQRGRPVCPMLHNQYNVKVETEYIWLQSSESLLSRDLPKTQGFLM